MPEDAFQTDASEDDDDDTDICWIWPENAATGTVFLSLGTQWRMIPPPMGEPPRFQGLIYAEAECALRMMQIPRRDWPEIFEGLRVMETAALRVLNKAR